MTIHFRLRMPAPAALSILAALYLATAAAAYGFCGCFVAPLVTPKVDALLLNKASQVVLARYDNHTVITMANDYRGALTEFAMIVPVPSVIKRHQIQVVDKTLIDRMNAYTAPRLEEFFDKDPCPHSSGADKEISNTAIVTASASQGALAQGVSVEAAYTIGEYDIVILAAEQSDALGTWLRRNGYAIPSGARDALGSYIKQGMHFFVAKVNLGTQSKLGYTYLRPLQIAFESPKFMLPIRLGFVNADGPQDLLLYTLTRVGRVETTNYRTVKMPTDVSIPAYIKDEFTDFYNALFDRQVEQHHRRGVFLEYAWSANRCKPCAAAPLSPEELYQLGALWSAAAWPQTQPVFVTRLHIRYDSDHFPEDLMLQETGDQTLFQSRYELHHPWQGRTHCRAVERYRADVAIRQERAAQLLASYTGWNIERIRARIRSYNAQH